jgi:hypothetical protein
MLEHWYKTNECKWWMNNANMVCVFRGGFDAYIWSGLELDQDMHIVLEIIARRREMQSMALNLCFIVETSP